MSTEQFLLGMNINMRIKLIVFGLALSFTGFSQTIDTILIKGQMISKDKNPLPGVLIQINNTTKGTVSDVCGLFEIWAPIESVLKFSMISEPYYMSLFSMGLPDRNDFMTFRFDFEQKSNDCKSEIKKGRIIKIDKDNKGNFSEIFIARYDRDFKRITKRYYDEFIAKDKIIIFFDNCGALDSDITPDDINYGKVNQISIIRNVDNYDKILFMLSFNEKCKK